MHLFGAAPVVIHAQRRQQGGDNAAPQRQQQHRDFAQAFQQDKRREQAGKGDGGEQQRVVPRPDAVGAALEQGVKTKPLHQTDGQPRGGMAGQVARFAHHLRDGFRVWQCFGRGRRQFCARLQRDARRQV